MVAPAFGDFLMALAGEIMLQPCSGEIAAGVDAGDHECASNAGHVPGKPDAGKCACGT